jgi:hypothetical protein
VAGATTYEVTIATDPRLASTISREPIETAGLSLAPPTTLHLGTYYWAVTPTDAEGNKGVRSKIRSFHWRWNNVPGNLQVHDLVGASDLVDFGSSLESDLYLPQFTWDPVPGASRYELEINSDESWAIGSRVCCNEKILAPTFTPTESFKSNVYYWRVRAFDATGNPGTWSTPGKATAKKDPDAFAKTFDNVCIGELQVNCVPSPGPSLQALRIIDWSGAVVTGGGTSSPMAIWDPVPGASSYEYDVTRYVNNACDFTWPGNDHWRGTTAVNAWSPLGVRPTSVKPYPDRHPISDDSEAPVAGAHYCIRVRAVTASSKSGPVYGDYTTISNAFTFSGPQAGVVSTLGGGDYLAPAQGAPSDPLRSMPVFRWRPVAGAKSYWVLVSKDPSFTNIVDYAFTQVPVYAPRTNSGDTTYPDETTTYYWAVLPAQSANGQGASGDPVNIQHGTFQKQVPPGKPSVSLSQVQPVFRWQPVVGAKEYDLEVSVDPNFGSTVEHVTTVAPAYTAGVTYPAGKKLHWRVRANDDQDVGLSWATGDFEYRLPTPTLAVNSTSGDTIPTWRWRPVPGAVSYDIHADLPTGRHQNFSRLPTAAFTAIKFEGTGIFHWQVRANFPGSSSGAHGPYTRRVAFAHTIKAPTGAHSVGGPTSIALVWNPKIAIDHYKVEVSSKPDFSSTTEQATTDNPVYAPRLSSSYHKGGVFYWRVTAVDGMGNIGDPSKTGSFRIPASGKQRR